MMISKRSFALILLSLSILVFRSPCLGESPRLNAPPVENTTISPELPPTVIEPAPTATAIPFATLEPGFEKNFQVMNSMTLSGRIAFSTAIEGKERVLVLDLNSGRVRKLIEGPGNNYYPSWSPDGRKIAFTSDRDGNKEIYVADWDGSNQSRLTVNNVSDDNATWTPDGTHIVYYSDANKKEDSDSNIFMVSSHGGLPSQITQFSGRNTTPRVSPDGALIAYSTNRFWPGWDVCIWNLSTRQETCPLQGKASFCRATWSPSGKLFTYSMGMFEAIEIGYLSFGTKEKKQLTELGGKEYDPTWSPSESLIAFVSDADSREIFNIYLVDLQRKVTPLLKSGYSIRYPTWTGAKTFELEANRLREAEAKLEETQRFAREAATIAAQSPSPLPTLAVQ